MWSTHINTYRNPGTDIVSEIISYFRDIFKGITIFCRKSFFNKVFDSEVFSRLILHRADVFFVRTSVRYFLIDLKGCEPFDVRSKRQYIRQAVYWKNDNWILLKDCSILYRGIALIRSDLPDKARAAAEHKGRLIPYVRTQGWSTQRLSHFCDRDMITYFTSKVNTYLQPYLYDAGLFPVFISVTIGCLSEVRCKLYSLWIYKIKCCEQMCKAGSFFESIAELVRLLLEEKLSP